MVTVTIKQVIGRAGTGKTTYAKRVAEYYIKRNKKVYCLSITHSAVENMRCKGFPANCHFSTIHSFFRVNFEGMVMGCYKDFDVLIIDEFSLVSADILVNCIKSIYMAAKNLALTDCQLYLFGDPLQLGGFNINDTIDFTTLNEAFKLIPVQTIPVNYLTSIIRHWARLCINNALVKDLTEKTLTLTTNYRSNDSVMQLVETAVMNGNNIDILKYLYTTDDIIKMIRDEGYVVIASRYDILKRINERAYINDTVLLYHDWRYRKGESVYMTVNTNTLFNGEIVTLVDANDTSITIEGKNGKDIITDLYISNVLEEKTSSTVPIALPTYLYTFHKSQGLEFDNVAICIDDLFEFPMLYTGITRARKNVKFFTMNSMLFTELDAFFGTTFNHAKMASFNDNLLIDESKRKTLNEILSKYINNGTVEINAIKNTYETKNIDTDR
jgi:hypothetical protein